jgi:hypothetical protein
MIPMEDNRPIDLCVQRFTKSTPGIIPGILNGPNNDQFTRFVTLAPTVFKIKHEHCLRAFPQTHPPLSTSCYTLGADSLHFVLGYLGTIPSPLLALRPAD